jgi:hypothetical protein
MKSLLFPRPYTNNLVDEVTNAADDVIVVAARSIQKDPSRLAMPPPLLTVDALARPRPRCPRRRPPLPSPPPPHCSSGLV